MRSIPKPTVAIRLAVFQEYGGGIVWKSPVLRASHIRIHSWRRWLLSWLPMVLRTSFKGLLIWFGIAGALALLGLSAVETDEVCGKWGYTLVDDSTCRASGGYLVAAFFGGNCLLAGASLVWSLMKRSKISRTYGPVSGLSRGFSPSSAPVPGGRPLPPPAGPSAPSARPSLPPPTVDGRSSGDVVDGPSR